MIHPLLKQTADFINNRVPFRAAEYARVVDMLSEANGELNYAIITGRVDGSDVPGIERQMDDLLTLAKQRLKSPKPAQVKHLAKVIPFEVGLRKRQPA